VITTPPGNPVPARLAELLGEVRALLDECRPAVVAVERVLFQTNVQTAMSVGQASGVVMAEAAARGCEVVEYSPNQVKEAVAGYGAAGKEQVTQMVQTLLGLSRPPRPADAADAAAIALCHLAQSSVLVAGGRR
jgi:crossover junction endodeoxyribonuclease RuvC